MPRTEARASSSPGMVRARHPQTLLELVAERTPLLAEQIQGTLPADTRETLTIAAPSLWIPIVHDIRVVEAVRAHMAQSTIDALMQDRARREMGSPLFKGFVATVLRLFGDSAAVVVKQIGKGWQQVFQETGTYEVVSLEDDAAVAMLRDLPPECRASAPWMGGIAVALAPLFELVQATATVRSTLEKNGELRLDFAWRRAGRKTVTPPRSRPPG